MPGGKPKPKRRVIRRSTRRFHRAKKKIPLAVVGSVALTPFIEPESGWGTIADKVASGNYSDAANIAAKGFFNYNVKASKFDGLPVGRFMGVIAAGVVAHKVAGALGVNRLMGKMPGILGKLEL